MVDLIVTMTIAVTVYLPIQFWALELGEAGNREKGRGDFARRIWDGPDDTKWPPPICLRLQARSRMLTAV